MKYIKKFEEKLNEIQKGEYILLDFSATIYKGLFYDFLENNIGQFILDDYFYAIIKYENIPVNLQKEFGEDNCITVDIDFIYKHSFDKNELESYLASKKYNL